MTDTSNPFSVDASVLPESLQPYIGVLPLNSMQVEAIPRVLQSTRNVVIAAPTGSGKTLVAEAALLQECRERGRIGVYLAPMRAIATEKHDDWQRLEALGIRVYKTTGEDGAFDHTQALNADIIVATPEKWDSISRRNLSPELVDRIGVIVMDEVHLVDDGQRGARQEAMLVRTPQVFPDARIVTMSGTLSNAGIIAGWLNATLVESQWRPVTLSKRVVTYRPSGEWEQDAEARNRIAARIASKTHDNGGATLIFCGSRKGAERCAASLANILHLAAPRYIDPCQKPLLRQVLADGIGFYHSGLSQNDRVVVDRLFRSGDIKILVATSGLAAGVNLPARVVIVRDLYLGSTGLSAADLLQMAGRAGRPRLETEGHCYVITPEADTTRVKDMLRGHPVGSRLGDDLATHMNTEIVLGLVRSRAEVDQWYSRTLHAVVAQHKVDLTGAVQRLLSHGFATEDNGKIRPTELARATCDCLLQVDTAIALERFLISRTTSLADAAALEEELLVAACSLPVELNGLVNRLEGDSLQRAMSAYNPSIGSWAGARLQYLAIAACILSGKSTDGLTGEDSGLMVASVQQDLARFLRFLARRANEQMPAVPDIAIVAADLATALEYKIPQRGAGGLVDAIKRAYPPDQERLGKVRREYTRLRSQGIENLKEALPFLATKSHQLGDALPQGSLTLTATDEHLILGIPKTKGRLRVHIRISGPSEIVRSVEASDLGGLQIARLAELGEPGTQTKVTVEAIISSGASLNIWAYGKKSLELRLPESTVDYQAIERVLRAHPADNGDGKLETPRSDAPAFTVEYRMSRGEFDRLVLNVPECISKAATRLSQALGDDADKIEAIVRLLRRRTLSPATGATRPLQVIAGSDFLTSKEAAELATALLWAMHIHARPLPATLDGKPASVFGVRHEDRWYWLPVWPDLPFAVHQETIQVWQRGQSQTQQMGIGWSVIQAYKTITPRRLPIATIAIAPPGK